MRTKSEGREANIRERPLPFCWLSKLRIFSTVLTIFSGFSFSKIFF